MERAIAAVAAAVHLRVRAQARQQHGHRLKNFLVHAVSFPAGVKVGCALMRRSFGTSQLNRNTAISARPGFVCWPALTLTLSLGEREQRFAPLEISDILCVVAACWSFAEKMPDD